MYGGLFCAGIQIISSCFDYVLMSSRASQHVLRSRFTWVSLKVTSGHACLWPVCDFIMKCLFRFLLILPATQDVPRVIGCM